MSQQDVIDYHSTRASKEMDLGLTTNVMAASRAHLKLAALHMRRVRELTGQSNTGRMERRRPALVM